MKKELHHRRKWCADRLGVPAVADNDVRSAATAELLAEGESTVPILSANAGTGLAAGFVIDGKVLHRLL